MHSALQDAHGPGTVGSPRMAAPPHASAAPDSSDKASGHVVLTVAQRVVVPGGLPVSAQRPVTSHAEPTWTVLTTTNRHVANESATTGALAVSNTSRAATAATTTTTTTTTTTATVTSPGAASTEPAPRSTVPPAATASVPGSGSTQPAASAKDAQGFRNPRLPGTPPDAAGGLAGLTPLMVAALDGDCAAVMALVEAGASVFAAIPVSAKELVLHRATHPANTPAWYPGASVTPFELAIEAGQIEAAATMLVCCRGRDEMWRDGRLRALVDNAISRCNWEIAKRIFDASKSCGLWLRGRTINARYAIVLAHRQWPLAERFLACAFSMTLSAKQVHQLALQTVREGNERLVALLLQGLRPDSRQCSELFEEALEHRNWRTLDAMLDTLDPDGQHDVLLHRALCKVVANGLPGLARRIMDVAAIEGQSLWRGRHSLYALMVSEGNAGGLAVMVRVRAIPAPVLFERLLRQSQAALAQSVQHALGLDFSAAKLPALPARRRWSEKVFNALSEGVQGLARNHAHQRRIALAALMALGLRAAVAETVLHRHRYLVQTLAHTASEGEGLTGKQARLAFAALLAEVGMHPQRETSAADSLAANDGAERQSDHGEEAQQRRLLRMVSRDVLARAVSPLANALQRDGLGRWANASDGARRSIERTLVVDAGLPRTVAAMLVDTWLGLSPPAHRLDYLRVPRDQDWRGSASLVRSAPATLRAAQRSAFVQPAQLAKAVLTRLPALHAALAQGQGALQPWTRYWVEAIAQVCASIIGQESAEPPPPASPGD